MQNTKVLATQANTYTLLQQGDVVCIASHIVSSSCELLTEYLAIKLSDSNSSIQDSIRKIPASFM